MGIREQLGSKIGQTRVKRYWPGKAPEWADKEDPVLCTSSSSLQQNLEQAFPGIKDSSSTRADDPRLRRLAENRAENREEVRADHRRIRQAEIVSTIDEENGAEDEDAWEERRRRTRENLLQRRQQEERELVPVEEEDEEAEYEEESEYETDSEEEEMNRRTMANPTFTPKQERETIAERERLKAKEQALVEEIKRRLKERKVETKQIVVEKIREDEDMRKNNVEADADIGDADDELLNEAVEYESWKAREIARIKTDRGNREAMLKEKEEVGKVRNMTEEEKREWERNMPALKRPKLRFMQKYHHKGAFFQSNADDRAATAGTDNIYNRDFSAPTGEDKFDKLKLPKVMQVKHLGRRGRTKWTHLVNEDTTYCSINPSARLHVNGNRKRKCGHQNADFVKM